MALPLPPGLTPNEVGFLCEMESVTVIPRQRLESLDLLGGPTPPLTPPFPATVPLWLALLLKKQKRANILPPRWLTANALTALLEFETDDRTAGVLAPGPPPPGPAPMGVSLAHEPYLSRDAHELAPPFAPDAATARARGDALPYHWLEVGSLLLAQAGEDFEEPDEVRRLLRDLREVRMSKLRKGFKVLGPGAGVKMNGVGGMEVAEIRGFVAGMVDGLRKINRSREEARRDDDDGDDGMDGGRYGDDDEDDMQL